MPGFQNDGDNEITGLHVSDGDAGINGILGAKVPRPFTDGRRVFYTQQHGDNPTWEIIAGSGAQPDQTKQQREARAGDLGGSMTCANRVIFGRSSGARQVGCAMRAR